MPLILGTNSIKDTGYDVANSARFNSASSDHLKWTSSPAGNRQKFTWSCWFKRSSVGATQILVASSYSSGDEGYLYLSSGGSLGWQTSGSGGNMGNLYTNRLFRDLTSWYHVVFAVDTTQSTATNRIKLYINGSQYTWDGGTTQPDQDKQIYFNVGNNYFPYIGRRHGGDYFDGYMAEIVQIDDQQLDATSFGEFDSKSPTVWKPKDVSDLTFGGNTSYYLDFADSSALGNDVSGQNNDWGVVNLTAADQTTDTCTNNFATIDTLSTNLFDPATTVFSEGNVKHVAGPNANYNGLWRSNIGVNSGKWYVELKLGSHSTTSGHSFGIYRENVGYNATDGDLPISDLIRIVFADSSRYVHQFGSIVQTGLGSTSTGDIFGLYFDADNGKLAVQKNGSNYITEITGMTIAGYTWFFHTQGEVQSSRNLTFEHNYGNPSFSISSANADPNSYGKFEYSTTYSSVDYYALNTKNLAEYG